MTQSPLFAPLASRAMIAVEGPDWRPFLQGLLTQDVESQACGTLRFGGLLTPQGRLLYDLFILAKETGCWLDVAAPYRDALIQRLTLYRLRAKVTISASPLLVSAVWKTESAEGFLSDPRLSVLGLRGYGAVPPGTASEAPEAAYQAHRLALVAAEIVHDDDVAGLQRRAEHVLDVDQETLAVDRPVEHAGCIDPVVAECGEERQRAPLAERSMRDQRLAARCPTPDRRHVRLRPGLVDEDQAVRIEPAPAMPGMASG
jgi:folate-binding Fe-S cluster repair protein YgfZ